MQEMDAAAAAGCIALQHCTSCGSVQYPPREVCLTCLDDALEWRRSEHVAGELLAVAMLHHSFEPAFRERLPRRVGLVRILGGPTAVSFVGGGCAGGDAVRVTASLDAEGRAVLFAAA